MQGELHGHRNKADSGLSLRSPVLQGERGSSLKAVPILRCSYCGQHLDVYGPTKQRVVRKRVGQGHVRYWTGCGCGERA